MAQTQTATGLATRYNMIGVIAALRVFKDDESGAIKSASFKLIREGKKPQHCIAFAEKAAALTEQFKDGDTAKLFGFFRPHSFKATDGEQVTYNRFQLLWSGAPTARDNPAGEPSEPAADQANEPALAEDPIGVDAAAADQGEENPFGEFAS